MRKKSGGFVGKAIESEEEHCAGGGFSRFAF